MKKLMAFGIIGVWIILLLTACGHPQGSKEDPLKKQLQADTIPISDRYVIGPEDVLYIHVWKEETLSRSVPVRIDGKISLPLVDDVQAAGYTPLQLKETLTGKLKGFIDAPVVSVIVTEANSFKIYVYGEVKSPGVHRLRTETSLLRFITMVGGFTEWANQKEILIIRTVEGREKRITVNYKKILKGEDPNSNILLKSGDIIVVR
jgi:polysaccharide export outer membrane protein